MLRGALAVRVPGNAQPRKEHGGTQAAIANLVHEGCRVALGRLGCAVVIDPSTKWARPLCMWGPATHPTDRVTLSRMWL